MAGRPLLTGFRAFWVPGYYLVQCDRAIVALPRFPVRQTSFLLIPSLVVTFVPRHELRTCCCAGDRTANKQGLYAQVPVATR